MADSGISRIDPVSGRVFFRGYEIDELASKSTFEEVILLLWNGELPTIDELARFRRSLAEGRALPSDVLSIMERIPPDCDATDALSLGISALGVFDKRGGGFHGDAISITAKTGTLVAAISRIKQGKPPVQPNPDLDYATDFLRMMRDSRPDDSDAGLMDKLLILHAEHEMTVSTFAARVVASTLADTYSAFGAAVEAFKGPLHAGASEGVMKMVDRIAGPGDVEGFLADKFSKREKVMGFGHRVFLGSNHITAMMKAYCESFATRDVERKKLAVLAAMEKMMLEKKALYPNMDYYSGLLFEHLGIPAFLFVPVFAAGRAPGILAHIDEQSNGNRLIRPSINYTGSGTRSYIPPAQR